MLRPFAQQDSPPCPHDDRLPMLDNAVEVFNLVLGAKLSTAGKAGLVAFPRAL